MLINRREHSIPMHFRQFPLISLRYSCFKAIPETSRLTITTRLIFSNRIIVKVFSVRYSQYQHNYGISVYGVGDAVWSVSITIKTSLYFYGFFQSCHFHDPASREWKIGNGFLLWAVPASFAGRAAPLCRLSCRWYWEAPADPFADQRADRARFLFDNWCIWSLLSGRP